MVKQTDDVSCRSATEHPRARRCEPTEAQDAGQFGGNLAVFPTFFIAGVYRVTPGGAALDQTTWVQVAVLQSVTKVKDGPFSTIGQLQMALLG